LANIVLGVWLFISAFVLEHTTTAAKVNTWIVGLIIAVVALVGLSRPTARSVNSVAAVWLFLSTLWIYPQTPASGWNNVIVAVLVFAISFLPSGGATTTAIR
jgi:hypothetical protein